MKAKLKDSGEIIKIADYDRVILDVCNSWGNPIEVGYEDVEQFYDDKDVPICISKIETPKTLEVNNSVDWDKARINAAIATMQGLLSNRTDDTIENYVNVSVKLADALIEELKKGK